MPADASGTLYMHFVNQPLNRLAPATVECLSLRRACTYNMSVLLRVRLRVWLCVFIAWMCHQSFAKTVEIPERSRGDVIPAAVSYALSCMTPASDTSAAPSGSATGSGATAGAGAAPSPPIAFTWRQAVSTLLYYIHNALTSPHDATLRRINSHNPSLRRRMDVVPLPGAALLPPGASAAAKAPSQRSARSPSPGRGRAKASPATRVPLCHWPALPMLTAAGWVAGIDRWLVLPPTVTTTALAARALELRAALALITAAEKAEQASAAAAVGVAVSNDGMMLQRPQLAGGDRARPSSASALPVSGSGGGQHRTSSVSPGPLARSGTASAARRHGGGTAGAMPRPRASSAGAHGRGRPVLGSGGHATSLALAGSGGGGTVVTGAAPAVPAVVSDVAAQVQAAAARSLAAIGPGAVAQLLQGADSALATQQAKVLELEAKVSGPSRVVGFAPLPC